MARIPFEREAQRREALADAVCVFGVFDGLHRGHRFIIDEALKAARSEGRSTVIVTFDEDPDDHFKRPGFKKIMGDEERISSLEGTGVDDIIVIHFDDDFASLVPEEALDTIFGSNPPSLLLVGRDVRFGKHAAGDLVDIEKWGGEHSMDVIGEDLLIADGEPITSTRIRSLLAEGKLSLANDLLGYPYRFIGRVHEGRHEGRELGFRTANFAIPYDQRVLLYGVYGGYALVDGVRYKAAINVGIPPTFEDTAKDDLEVHILDFDGDLYGKEVVVEFMEYLRPQKRFDDPEELSRTIGRDVSWIQENL